MNKNKLMFIEKFKGKFDEIDGGCTTQHTKQIQALTDMNNLGVYTYLCSLPPEWKINPEHLASHLRVGIKKIWSILKSLIEIGLIEREEKREKGKFFEFNYFVYLDNNIEQRISNKPFSHKRRMDKLSTDHSPKNRSVVSPLSEKGSAYKEDTLHYKKKSIKKGGDSTTSKPKVNPKPPLPDEYQDYAYWNKELEYLIPKEMKLIIKKVNDWKLHNNMV